jgi:hypothetical protein
MKHKDHGRMKLVREKESGGEQKSEAPSMSGLNLTCLEWEAYWQARADLSDQFGLSEEAGMARIQAMMARLMHHELNAGERTHGYSASRMWETMAFESVGRIIGYDSRTGHAAFQERQGASSKPLPVPPVSERSGTGIRRAAGGIR